jgi:hypothetical protein
VVKLEVTVVVAEQVRQHPSRFGCWGAEWTRYTKATVDGGTLITLLARGITGEGAWLLSPNDVLSFVQTLAQSKDDNRIHDPGGVPSSTGNDGWFGIYVATDGDGKIIEVKIYGPVAFDG